MYVKGLEKEKERIVGFGPSKLNNRLNFKSVFSILISHKFNSIKNILSGLNYFGMI